MVAFHFTPVSRPLDEELLLAIIDGDTVDIRATVRMVSIDTPEKEHVAGPPVTAQATLDRCRTRLMDGTYDALPQDLRDYLIGRITPDAAARHIAAGNRATAELQALKQRRLTRPDGTERKARVIATGELIEDNGRILGYLTPWFAGSAADPLPPPSDPDRRTMNLDMVASGWAAMFLIYPSIPRDADLALLLDAADTAWTGKLGAWAEFGHDLLLGYEYRACIKLGVKNLIDPAKTIDKAYRRVCIDLQNLQNVGLYGYHQVPPQHRLWIWQDQIQQASHALGLPQ
ncbi:hypothetical protein AB0L53_49905 [Nonomuraea sp. NPDC052129]|uniref:hypothetical protein n=1 Tax=Nonomuraea sp. NPDC052129 TaxID=3154651 RepID=UPI00341DBB4D